MEFSTFIASHLYANYKLDFSRKIYKFLALGLSAESKYNYLGMLKFYEEDFQAAIRYFIQQLKLSPAYPSAYTNLAFVSAFYSDESTKEFVIEEIEKHFPENKKFLKLKFSLLLSLNKQKAIKEIHAIYIDKWISKAVVRSAKKPILFFHIPKCGGTTLTDLLYNYFYQSEVFCLPNYFEVDLLRYCVEELADTFPFLSSRHLSLDDFKPTLSEFYTITCLRDPLKRTTSAFRQTRSGNKNGRFFKVIPRYGSYWNTGKVLNFKDWINVAPEKELNRQLSTFSQKMNTNEFLTIIEKLDYVMFLEDFQRQQLELMKQLGIRDNEKKDHNKKLNQSSKKIKISSEEILYAKGKLQKEDQAIMGFRSAIKR